MAGKVRRSPSPSEVGIPLVDRRRFMLGAAAALGATAFLAACGDSDDDAAGTTTTATPTGTGDLGQVSLGGAFTGGVQERAMLAAIAATGLDVRFNNVDRNSWVDNFNTYLQQPDDVIGWYAGYRMRAFARRGVIGDISDVWGDLSGFSEGFKNASTGLDGKQYFVPFSFYPWAIFYRKSLFEEQGYAIPTTWDDFLGLCEQCQSDGIIPLASANDGGWPQMGWFDMINMRTNGYDFHVSLMGGNESWEDDRVKQVFTNWNTALPHYQPNFAARTWQEAATSLGDKESAMYLLGSFMVSNFDPENDPGAQEIIDDIEFFNFPAIDPAHGQDAIEAPIDGWLLAQSPSNPEGAKALISALGGVGAQSEYVGANSSVIAANSDVDQSGYDRLQKKAVEFVGQAKFIAQFLDRDTDPDFAASVVGPAIQDFLSGGDIDSILSRVEAQKSTYTFE
jgi:multiple sugar transport system substrate-binding protein